MPPWFCSLGGAWESACPTSSRGKMEMLVHGPLLECQCLRRPRRPASACLFGFLPWDSPWMQCCSHWPISSLSAMCGLSSQGWQHFTSWLLLSVKDPPQISLCSLCWSSRLHVTMAHYASHKVHHTCYFLFKACYKVQVRESRNHAYVIYCPITGYGLAKVLDT